MKLIASFFVFFILNLAAFAQNDYLLGIEFYQNNEFQKSAPIFAKLWKQQPAQQTYYQYYYKSLLGLAFFDQAEKIARQQSKAFQDIIGINVDVYHALMLQEQNKKADNLIRDVFKKFPTNEHSVRELADAFKQYKYYQLALDTYLKGRQQLKQKGGFAPELSDLYYQSNQKQLMIEALLDWMQTAPDQIALIQNLLQARLDDDDYDLLKNTLLQKVQANPNDFLLAELMMWFFVQKKDFDIAFNQAKAIEKRFNEGGNRILNLARIAAENQYFEQSLNMYNTLIAGNYPESVFQDARLEFIETKRQFLAQNGVLNTADLQKLKGLYYSILKDQGFRPTNLKAQMGLASLMASYLNELDSAIALMENAKNLTALRPADLAQVKLDLGDYLLMSGDVWEPALLYGQVERDQKDAALGQEAKFKNAKLSFFRGDFELAAEQMKVLKAATSQKTANDALSLSLLIQDNLAQDSTTDALLLYAQADLLRFRKQFVASDSVLVYLQRAYKGHPIQDEVLFARAQIAEEKRDFDAAISFYKELLAAYPDDILADDAAFALANIFEYKLKDMDKAKEFLQILVLNYNNSTFAVDARKRYRVLRGEKIN